MAFWSREWRARKVLSACGIVVLGAYLVGLGRQLYLRALFPWDLLTVFESSHLTALIKLHHGVSIYSDPLLANSEPYPPFAPYVSYALLQPLGLELDIRACRVVAITITLLTTAASTVMVRRILDRLGSDLCVLRTLTWPLAGAIFLFIHKGMNSDQPHPDNLYVLHAVVLWLLLDRAFTSERLSSAIWASLWVALAIGIKQTAWLAPAGVVAVWMLAGPWPLRTRVWLSLLTLTAAATVLWLILRMPNAYWHLVGAMTNHDVNWLIALGQLRDVSPMQLWPRPLLLVLTPAAAYLLHRNTAGRRAAELWVTICLVELGPSVVAFAKEGGNYNNLAALDLWSMLVTAPVLLSLICPRTGTAEMPADPCLQPIVAALLVGLLLSLYPVKFVPRPAEYSLAQAIETNVRRDLAAGRKVWVTMGASARLRAGDTSVPEDTGIGLVTLEMSRVNGARALDRIRARFYDRIYDNFASLENLASLPRGRYRLVATLPGAPFLDQEYKGIQDLLISCAVYERDSTAASTHQP